MSTPSYGLSTHEIIERFDTPAAAKKYAASLIGTATDRREKRCITRALASVPAGSYVLDMPCGTGRLLPFLGSRGYRLAASDSSPHMIEFARQMAAEHNLGMGDDDFRVADVFSSGFADDTFDAVVCNRLLHHFSDSLDRQRALAELGRICRGTIVVSFFCSQGWDAIASRIRDAIRRRRLTDRIPIPYRTFARDVAAAGLTVQDVIPTRPLISKQWYVSLNRGGHGAALRPTTTANP